MRLYNLCLQKYSQGKRLVAPLAGFPGCRMCNISIKLAQQNFRLHTESVISLYKKLNPDMIFPLMDLSIEANALGRYTVFPQHESATVPLMNFDLKDLVFFSKVNIADDSRAMSYVQTIQHLKQQVSSQTLIGAYVTGPFTLCGLIMGAENAVTAALTDPDQLRSLSGIAAAMISDFSNLLTKAGADVICILEPSGVMLNPELFEEFSAGIIKDIVIQLAQQNVEAVYHVCGNSNHLIVAMVNSGVAALSLDSVQSGMNFPKIAAKIPEEIVLIGNINPTGKILGGNPVQVKCETENLLRSMDRFPNFILSTGCDLPPETPIENIAAMVETGKNYKISTQRT